MKIMTDNWWYGDGAELVNELVKNIVAGKWKNFDIAVQKIDGAALTEAICSGECPAATGWYGVHDTDLFDHDDSELELVGGYYGGGYFYSANILKDDEPAQIRKQLVELLGNVLCDECGGDIEKAMLVIDYSAYSKFPRVDPTRPRCVCPTCDTKFTMAAGKLPELFEGMCKKCGQTYVSYNPEDPNEIRKVEDAVKKRTVIETCPNCDNEIEMQWSILEQGFKAHCPYCGERLMLCDECQHRKGYWNGDCDYCSSKDTCRFYKG